MLDVVLLLKLYVMAFVGVCMIHLVASQCLEVSRGRAEIGGGTGATQDSSQNKKAHALPILQGL